MVRRQRLVGPGVRQRVPGDGRAPLPARRRARAALHRDRRLGPAGQAGSGGTPITPTRPARRSRRARCWRRCSTSRRTRPSRSRQALKFLAWANTSGFSAANGLYAGSNLDPDADRLHRGAADLRPGGAVHASRRPRQTANARSSCRRPRSSASATCWTSPRSTTRSTCSGCSRCTRCRTTPCSTRSRPTTHTTRRRARSTAKGCTCSPGTAKRCRRQYACAGHAPDAGSHHQPVRVAGRLSAAGLSTPGRSARAPHRCAPVRSAGARAGLARCARLARSTQRSPAPTSAAALSASAAASLRGRAPATAARRTLGAAACSSASTTREWPANAPLRPNT